jgi:serine/threonine protein phosphatase 1
MINWAKSFFSSAGTTERPRTSEGIRLYGIGDIHGRLDLLTEVLKRIGRDNHVRPSAPTQFVFTGDYIDRGPDSAAVCNLMASIAKQEHIYCLKGNHEAMLINILGGDHESVRFWMQNGGDAAARSWGMDEDLIDMATVDIDSGFAVVEHLREVIPWDVQKWLEALLPYHVVGDYLFVHAGLRPGVPLQEQKENDMLWIRNSFLRCTTPFPHFIVHGHSQTGTPDMRDYRAGIDTGAYRTGVLTAIGIHEDNHWFLQTNDGVPQGEVIAPE